MMHGDGGSVMKAEVHCGGGGGWCYVTSVVKYNVVWCNRVVMEENGVVWV